MRAFCVLLLACASDHHFGAEAGAPLAADDAAISVDAASAVTCDTLEAKHLPGNAMFVVDRSTAMQVEVNQKTRFTAVKEAFGAFVPGLPFDARYGAMLFPQGDPPVACCTQTAQGAVHCKCAKKDLPPAAARCDSSSYSAPVAVGDPTKQHADDLAQLFSGSEGAFYWGSPLATALAAAVDMMRTIKTSGTLSIVVVTDGRTTGCSSSQDPKANSIARVVDAAANGLAGDPSIRTYVIGVDDAPNTPKPANLSKIAKAGGSERYAGCKIGRAHV